MLAIKNLSFSYSAHQSIFYSDFVFQPGVTVISGISGSGKSTFFKLIARLLIPKSGFISWKDMPIEQFEKDFYFKFVLAIVNQDAALSNYFSLRDYIRIFNSLYPSQNNDDTVSYYSQKLDIAHLFDQQIQDCSGGERYRISLLLALLKKTPLLCLDEPTAHLDEKNKDIIFSLLDELKETVILVITHDRSFIDYYQRVFFLDDTLRK
jgi:ABC-type multidrug transport system ATPase subunit